MYIQGKTTYKHKNIKNTFKQDRRCKLWNSNQCRSVSVLHNDLTIKQSISE